jgi:uncharacterized repeat protein (TIGR03803 family)
MVFLAFRPYRTAVAVWGLCASMAMTAPGQTLNTLLNLNGSNGDDIASGLVQGSNGNFYGTTESGGAYNHGSIFQMTPSGTLTTLYSFCPAANCVDGAQPGSALVQGTDGNFYGTTDGGGVGASGSGGGTVFQMTPSGVLTTLYTFCSQPSCADGKSPYGGLVQGSNGNFYGTTFYGGANEFNSAGTVFTITPSGSFTSLYSFCAQANCVDGYGPFAGIIQGTDGNFHGTTFYGGVMGEGTVFSMTPAGVVTTLYSFCSLANCTDGAGPYAGLVQGTDGNFYGTTFFGGANSEGSVFQMSPAGAIKTLYSFCAAANCTDGQGPRAGVVQGADGNFYGTTTEGGESEFSGGTLFKVTPTGALTTLYIFCSQPNCTDGDFPEGALVQGQDGNFYGSTADGGTNNDGTIFALNICSAGPKLCSSTAVSSTANPSFYAGSLSFTATVTPASGSGTPTGSVQFQDGSTVLGSSSLSSGVATFTTAGLSVGQHSISAVYSGDSNFNSSTGSLSQSIIQVSTSTAVTSNLNPAVYGQLVTFVATATTSTGGGTPTGSMVFKDGATTLGTVTMSGGSASFTTVYQLVAGTHAITATYSGDANCLTSVGSLTQQVNQATTSVALYSNLNPAFVNAAVTFTASVTGQYQGNPSGTVTFYSNGSALGAPVTLNAWQASLTTSFSAAGTYSITAVYSGDANDIGSTSSVVSEVADSAAPTTTTVKSSGSPSKIGALVTFTAKITSKLGIIPNGDSVSFFDGSAQIGIALVIGGSAVFSTSALTVGTHLVTAQYGGDASYQPSTSTATTQVVVKYTPTITATSLPNPSVYGESITFTVLVISTGPLPTGTVAFKNGSSGIGTAPLIAGVAIFSTSILPVGTNSITAVYEGDNFTAGLTSSAINQVVSQAVTTSSVVSSRNPSNPGQSVTLTVTVKSLYATPTGTVTFSLNGTTLGTATLAGGSGRLATTTLPVGSDVVEVSYAGTANFGKSSAQITQVIN